MQSPFIAIAAYEKKLGIPANYLNCSMYVHFKLPNIQGFSADHVLAPGVVPTAHGRNSNVAK
jgi:hypothetical protein